MQLFPFSVQGLSRGVRVRQRVRAAPAAGQRPRQDARGARGQGGGHARRRRGRRHQRRRRLCRRRRHHQGRKECDDGRFHLFNAHKLTYASVAKKTFLS